MLLQRYDFFLIYASKIDKFSQIYRIKSAKSVKFTDFVKKYTFSCVYEKFSLSLQRFS